jgi:hypothetical protein
LSFIDQPHVHNELLGSPIEPEEAKDRRRRKANLPLLNAKLIRLSLGCRLLRSHYALGSLSTSLLAFKPPDVIPALPACLAYRPPSGPDWEHEVKSDGYRGIPPQRPRVW